MPKEGNGGPKTRKLLTEVECRNARASSNRWRLSDRNHLFLLVMLNRRKYWQVRYTFEGHDQIFSIGAYVENAEGPRAFGLRAAREARNEIMAAVEAGHDPNEIKRAALDPTVAQAPAQRPDAGERSVRAIALRWMAYRAEGIVEDYEHTIQRRFEADVFPSSATWTWRTSPVR